MNKEQIKQYVYDLLRHSLEKTVEHRRVKWDTLSSTLLFVLTNGSEYITGHLGDGVILGERKTNWDVLSLPQNGGTRQSTYLTTMPMVQHHLRIEHAPCEDFARIWLLTDGMMYSVFRSNFALPAGETLAEAIQRSKKEDIFDDATYGTISWRGD